MVAERCSRLPTPYVMGTTAQSRIQAKSRQHTTLTAYNDIFWCTKSWVGAEQAPCELPLLSLLFGHTSTPCLLTCFANLTMFMVAERAPLLYGEGVNVSLSQVVSICFSIPTPPRDFEHNGFDRIAICSHDSLIAGSTGGHETSSILQVTSNRS